MFIRFDVITNVTDRRADGHCITAKTAPMHRIARTHSFPAKSATLAGCCRPGSVQSLRLGVQMSAQDGSWISVYLLPTRLRHLWPSPPAIGWPWSTVVISISHVWDLLHTEDVHLHTSALRIGTHFLLTLEIVVFLFHLLNTTSKPFSSLSTRLAHAARLGFFYKKTRYINSLLLLFGL